MKRPSLVSTVQASASDRIKHGSGDPEGKHCTTCRKKMAVPTKHQRCRICRTKAKKGAK